ncbi:MAG: hypothetical protein NDI69_01855 [Bacteriovoracaceae bacterium]|nr:hypothetical protein [Bacteriovoracaceae bacterium]
MLSILGSITTPNQKIAVMPKMRFAMSMKDSFFITTPLLTVVFGDRLH